MRRDTDPWHDCATESSSLIETLSHQFINRVSSEQLVRPYLCPHFYAGFLTVKSAKPLLYR